MRSGCQFLRTLTVKASSADSHGRQWQVAVNRELSSQRGAQGVCHVIEANGGPSCLNFFNLLTALHRLAVTWSGVKHNTPAPKNAVEIATIRSLANSLTRRLLLIEPDPEPRNQEVPLQWLSRIAWSAAKLSRQKELYPDVRSLLDHIGDLASARMDLSRGKKPKATSRDVSNLMWAYGALHAFTPQLLSACTRQIGHVAESLSAQDIANLMWAMARVSEPQTPVYQVLCHAATSSVQCFEGLGLAAVVSSMAKVFREVTPDGRPPELQSLLRAIATEFGSARESGPIITSIGTAELAQIVWAFSALSYQDRTVYSASATKAQQVGLRSFPARDLAAIAWSFANVSMADHTIMGDIASASLGVASSFDEQGLTNLCWSLAHAPTQDHKLAFEAVSTSLLTRQRLTSYSVRQLSNISWAFAESLYLDDALIRQVAHNACNKIQEFQGLELTALIWAFASLRAGNGSDHPADRLACSVSQLFSATDKCQALGAREAANMVWSLSVMGQCNSALLKTSSDILATDQSTSEAHLAQWYWAWLAHMLKYQNKDLTLWGSPSWIERCKLAAQHRSLHRLRSNPSSRLHQSVSEELRKTLGNCTLVRNEHLILDCLVVDVALPSCRVALEIDGPSHFVERLHAPHGEQVFERLELGGAAKLKHHLLQLDGWTVRSLPWYLWHRLHSSEERQIFLKNLLGLPDTHETFRK